MKLNILIVDDQELNRMLLAKMAKKLGHNVILATNGKEAVEKFETEAPQMVLMDAMMPDMNGIEATAIIKSSAGDHWVPIIMLSALSEQEDIIRGLSAGADDYIPKPVQIEILQAKLKNFERTIEIQNQIKVQNKELLHYRFQTEDEKRISSHLMQSLVDIERITVPGIDWWLQPADMFSGDILAAASTPSGRLHLMLADGTGHGLAAALSAQPLPEIFYAMTAHGYNISSIAKEINSRISRLLPVDRFFATTLVSIDTEETVIEVLNCGNPPVMLLGSDGFAVKTFKSQNLPLGINRLGNFQTETERASYIPGYQMLLASDGLMDVCQETRPEFTVDQLQSLLSEVDPSKRMEFIKTFVLESLEDTPPCDDISLFVISMDKLVKAKSSINLQKRNINSQQEDESWRLTLRLNGSQLRYMSQDVVPFMMGAIQHLSINHQYRDRLFLVLTELFNNSLDHGLLNMDSSLKNEVGGFDSYLQIREKRLAGLESQAYIEISIEITTDREIKTIIRDSGAGFDHKGFIQKLSDKKLHHGRGLSLLKGLGAQIEYPGAGNEVHVTLSFASS